MINWKIIVILVAVATVIATALTASAYAMIGGQLYPSMHGKNTAGNFGYSGSMMNGLYPTDINGMMNGNVYYRQGTGVGCGNHRQIPTYSANGTNSISINLALAYAKTFVTNLDNPDLAIKLIQEYSNNFYVQVTEKSTGNGAFELVVDKYTGAVFPEMGPNMMWNTKYQTATDGMMGGGMMIGYYGNKINSLTAMPINTTQANANAQQYLTDKYPGTLTGDVTTFYGYYTIEVIDNGNLSAWISVNGHTGQVWYHTWHGAFIQEVAAS